MSLQAIIAVADDGTIGDKGKLPWHLPTDLQHFKKLTLNKTVVMGRKTYESLPDSKLPNRNKIILTNNREYNTERDDTLITNNIPAIVNASQSKDVFIIGGAQIYKLFLPYIDWFYVTKVHVSPDGDTKIDIDFDESLDFCRVSDPGKSFKIEENGVSAEIFTYSAIRRK